MLLISLPLYAVALVLRETLGNSAGEELGAESFRSIAMSFFTVCRCAMGGECSQEDGKPIFVLLTSAYGWYYGVIYCMVIMLTTCSLFSIIVAAYVENTMASAAFYDRNLACQRMQDQKLVTDKILELLEMTWWVQKNFESSPEAALQATQSLDVGEMINEVMNIEINAELFEELWKYKAFHDILRALDIAEEDYLDFFDTFDADAAGTISMEELVTGVSKLHGTARRSDIFSLGLVTRQLQQTLAAFQATAVSAIRSQERSLLATLRATLQDCGTGPNSTLANKRAERGPAGGRPAPFGCYSTV